MIKTLQSHRIKFTINTDGPEMLRTNLRMEMEMMINRKVLTKREVLQTNTWAKEAIFFEQE